MAKKKAPDDEDAARLLEHIKRLGEDVVLRLLIQFIMNDLHPEASKKLSADPHSSRKTA